VSTAYHDNECDISVLIESCVKDGCNTGSIGIGNALEHGVLAAAAVVCARSMEEFDGAQLVTGFMNCLVNDAFCTFGQQLEAGKIELIRCKVSEDRATAVSSHRLEEHGVSVRMPNKSRGSKTGGCRYPSYGIGVLLSGATRDGRDYEMKGAARSRPNASGACPFKLSKSRDF